jgi:hypothetical protein
MAQSENEQSSEEEPNKYDSQTACCDAHIISQSMNQSEHCYSKIFQGLKAQVQENKTFCCTCAVLLSVGIASSDNWYMCGMLGGVSCSGINPDYEKSPKKAICRDCVVRVCVDFDACRRDALGGIMPPIAPYQECRCVTVFV